MLVIKIHHDKNSSIINILPLRSAEDKNIVSSAHILQHSWYRKLEKQSNTSGDYLWWFLLLFLMIFVFFFVCT